MAPKAKKQKNVTTEEIETINIQYNSLRHTGQSDSFIYRIYSEQSSLYFKMWFLHMNSTNYWQKMYAYFSIVFWGQYLSLEILQIINNHNP